MTDKTNHQSRFEKALAGSMIVNERLSLAAGGISMRTSLLTEGYVFAGNSRGASASGSNVWILPAEKPQASESLWSRGQVIGFSPTRGSVLLAPADPIDEFDVLFSVPDSYLLRRQRARTRAEAKLGTMRGRMPLTQHVHFIGVTADGSSHWPQSSVIDRDSLTVAFDRLPNRMLHYFGCTRAFDVVLPYVYENYAANVTMLHYCLSNLTLQDVLAVNVFVEGNPEVLDLAGDLPPAHRVITMEGAHPPMVAASLRRLGTELQWDILRDGHALLSGDSVRHDYSEAEQTALVAEVVASGILFAILEVAQSDATKLISILKDLCGDRSLWILQDMFSNKETWRCLGPIRDVQPSTISSGGGDMKTLVIDPRRGLAE